MLCADGDIKIDVNVDMVELLGSEKIAYFNIGTNRCSAKLPSDFSTETKLQLSINKEDLYLFDKESGSRIQ